MKILVFAEQRDLRFKKSAFETVFAARGIAATLGAEVTALVIGSGVRGIAPELGAYGASRVIAVDDPSLAAHSNTAYAKVIAAVAAERGRTDGLSPGEPDG